MMTKIRRIPAPALGLALILALLVPNSGRAQAANGPSFSTA